MPRAVLGIDAAWTPTQPSGVALAIETGRRWRCAAVAPSYADFVGLAEGVPVDWADGACKGSAPSIAVLLDAARRIAPGATVVVAAVDMPLAATPITCRRACDDAVSRAYGGRGLGVHSPTAERPGPIAARVYRGFVERGFRLATTGPRTPPGSPALVEVYPHTAALALTSASYRVPYKHARARRYWPDASPAERRARLLTEWRRILAALRRHLAGIDLPLPAAPPAAGRMKRYEDALDGLLCAWVAIEHLAGRAVPHGDEAGAIWSPGESSFTAARARRAVRSSTAPLRPLPSRARPSGAR